MRTTKPFPDSLWAATATPAPEFAPLREQLDTDVVVIGGGFTGLSSALHLRELDRQVCVLEAHAPGWGASGRNGGQVNPGVKVLPSALRQRFGQAKADAAFHAWNEATSLVFDLIARYQIDCDAVHEGYIQGAVGRRGIRYIQDWHDEWGALGAPVTMLSKAEVSGEVGTEYYDAGVLDARGGNVQPLSYCRGLARAAAAAGARIYAASPGISINRDGEDWRVVTPEGGVRARHVILATNGYTDHLWPGLRANVVPVKSVIVATAPLGDNTAATMLKEKRHVSETLRVQAYYRLDRDNRLVFGGRGDTFGDAESFDGTHLRHRASAMFPQLGEPDWEFCWGGYVAMTADYLPKLLTLAPNVYAGLGYNGRGVAMSTLMGKHLAGCIAGEQTALPTSQSAPMFMHRFHKLGVAARVAYSRMLDRIDEHG
jgi:glycine/D-amino acid oxidase-like deaminating enzyme